MPESIDERSDRTVAMEDIVRGAVTEMPEASRVRVRGNVLSSVRADIKPAYGAAVFMRAAAAFSALAIGMGGLSYAAASSVPGSALYPVKRAMEEAQVALTPGDARKADAFQEMAEERVREMNKLIEMDASKESMGKALRGFGDAVERTIEADPEPDPTPEQEPGSGADESGQKEGSSGSGSGAGAGAGPGTGSGSSADSDSGSGSSQSGPSGGSGESGGSGSGKP